MGYEEEKLRQLDLRYLRMARIWAENSYCVRRQVGALIVKDKMIISDGYNGTPSGFENICEDDMGKTKPYVLHAEANAITKVAKSANNCDGSTLYITAAPCIECSNLSFRQVSSVWYISMIIAQKMALICFAEWVSSVLNATRTNNNNP